MLNLLQSGIPRLEQLLPPDLMAQIKKTGRPVRFPEGKLIETRGTVARAFYIVSTGQAIAGSEGIDGVFRTAALMNPGDHFGEHTLLAGLPTLQNIRSIGDAALLHYNEDTFFRLYNTEPDFARALHVIEMRRLHFIMEFMEGQRRWPLNVRVVHILLTSVAEGHNDVSHTVTCRQEDLAELLGVSRVAVTKALKALEDEDLVSLGYGSIELRDVVKLQAWLEGNHMLVPVRPAADWTF